MWHVYEDLHSEALAARWEHPRVEAAIDLIARLHTRGVGHPLLPEVRWHGRDHSARSSIASLRDGIAVLEALATVRTPVTFAVARCRLLALTSRLEGGANVVSEAIASGVPVLSSYIAGSVGILGADYPGYFPVGDTDASVSSGSAFAVRAFNVSTSVTTCTGTSAGFSVARSSV